MAIQTNNLRRLLHTVEALSELGPALTAEREFSETSRLMLSAIMEAAGAREGVLFLFNDKPAMLTSATALGFALMPDPAFIPLLPKHVHALSAARGPIVLNSSTYSVFLSSNGNVAPELFKCLAPLKAGGRLAGVVGLGRRPGDSLYEDSELDALDLLCSYVALAVQNHALTQTIAQRVSENLRLMASLHGFYDNALEAFATAIDVDREHSRTLAARWSVRGRNRRCDGHGAERGCSPAQRRISARHREGRSRPTPIRKAGSARP